MVLLIDNYDSFTYNLVQHIRALGHEVLVVRNDQIRIDEIERLQPDQIIISPGPGRPADAGISLPVIRHFRERKPILGVCLGHQCIVEGFGGNVGEARRLMHGKTSEIHHDGSALYRHIPSPFRAMRYHSLIADRPLPADLVVTAETTSGEIMGLQHRQLPILGVQFHPESILTEHGLDILQNFFDNPAT